MIRILIVDDEELGRKAMEKIFAEYGQCTLVSTGNDAIKIYEEALDEESPFGLVILDISLEDISGLEVLKGIKKIEEEKEISENECATIVMATADSEKEMVMGCVKAGCKGYFIKPLKREPIVKRLSDLGFSPMES
ncbi:MAG: response regulator [Desulfobacteraceae bacterium]|nr:response regulator [Desulfobacteraceae bacterium]